MLPKSPFLGGRSGPASLHAHRGGERGRRAFGALPPPVPPTVRVDTLHSLTPSWPRPPLAFCSIVIHFHLGSVGSVQCLTTSRWDGEGWGRTGRPSDTLGGCVKKPDGFPWRRGKRGSTGATVQLSRRSGSGSLALAVPADQRVGGHSCTPLGRLAKPPFFHAHIASSGRPAPSSTGERGGGSLAM